MLPGHKVVMEKAVCATAEGLSFSWGMWSDVQARLEAAGLVSSGAIVWGCSGMVSSQQAVCHYSLHTAWPNTVPGAGNRGTFFGGDGSDCLTLSTSIYVVHCSMKHIWVHPKGSWVYTWDSPGSKKSLLLVMGWMDLE